MAFGLLIQPGMKNFKTTAGAVMLTALFIAIRPVLSGGAISGRDAVGAEAHATLDPGTEPELAAGPSSLDAR